MLQELLDECKFPSDYITDGSTDALEMPQAMRHFITGLLGQDPIRPPRPDSWTPPPFEEVDRYCYSLCKESRHLIDFGHFNSKNLTLCLLGRVHCWGDADNDLTGQGVMDLIYTAHVKRRVQVAVLGSILATGTAVLLDSIGNIWFYQTPNSVDNHVKGVAKAALVKFPKDGITIDTPIEFEEEYNNVEIALRDFGSEDEEE